MSRISLSVLFIVLFGCIFSAGCSKPISENAYYNLKKSDKYIVKEGEALAEIVIAENPTRMQKFAAEELQANLQKISGAKLSISSTLNKNIPIKIYVGKSKYTDKMGLDNSGLDYGAFKILSGDNYLVLFGRDTDTANRELGKGIYPVNRGDRNRTKKEWEKQVDGRWAFPYMSVFKSYNKKLGIWLSDEHGSLNAVNEYLRSLGARWYMPGKFGEVLPELKDIILPEVDKTVRPDVHGRSMGFYYNSFFEASEEEIRWQLRLGLYPNISLGGHGLRRVIDNDKTRKEHPEYYLLYQGKRMFKHRGSKSCLSSQGLLEAFAGYARYMHKNYDKKFISAMPSDGYTRICQCDLCKGKETPENGYKGFLSNYVWGFVDKASRVLAKTDPGIKVTCYAYGAYLKTPDTVEKFLPNVVAGICHWRSQFNNPETKKEYYGYRKAWMEKLTSKDFGIWDYYLHARPGGATYGIPVYFPRIIADDIGSYNGKITMEFIEVVRGFSSMRNPDKDDPCIATNHLNIYVTSRYWWDSKRGLDPMLNEYYEKFYGPAASGMKTFVEYCEKNWPKMNSSYESINEALRLYENAKTMADEQSIYGKRIALIGKFMENLPALSEKLEKGRKGNPEAVAAERDEKDLALDGKLDDKFWKGLKTYALKEVASGKDTVNDTKFNVALAGDSLYFGIRCEESNMDGLVVTAEKDEDNSIFNGDCVELMVETPVHSYYQIAFNPVGAVIDFDRANGINGKWSSGVKVKTYRGEGFWSAEIRLPIAGVNQYEINPDYGIAGEIPSAEKPWFFNLCRSRKAGKGNELSTFSPTGKKSFHVLLKFGKLMTKK